MFDRFKETIQLLPLVFGISLGVILVVLLLPSTSYAHGYIQNPSSRAYLCQQGMNVQCGQVQYEPQSLESTGSFPQSGPADGQITGAGIFPPLFEQSTSRWHKITLSGGANTFTWKLTAPHRTKEWKYYITKPTWNPDQPLTRSSLDLIPFCSYYDGGTIPSTIVTHPCNIPTDRSGYHIILGVWEIADTGNAFYQAIDVNLVQNRPGDGNTFPLWSSSKVYVKGDRVQYNSNNYEARWWTQNEPPDQSDVWKLIVKNTPESKSIKSYKTDYHLLLQKKYLALWRSLGDWFS